MAMVVKNNMSAVSTLNTLNKNSNALQKSLSKVSSGMKINSAQDDASGYAISERMRVQIRSLDQANQNTQNGSSMMKTAEGAVSSTVEILKSLKEKAINAANDTNKDADRVTIQKEIDQFIDQIDDNALTTFNGKYLVDGSKAQQGSETYTAMTNQSLAKDTTGDKKLIELKNRNNESLEIASTDYVTASFVQNGKTFTTKFNVGSDTTLKNVFEKLNDEYKAQTGDNTTAIFGAANTEIKTTEPMTAEEAKTLLNGKMTTENILKAAKTNAADTDVVFNNGTEDITVAKFKEAITTLYNDSTDGGDNFYASVGTADLKLDTAKANLETALDTAVTNLETEIGKVKFQPTGGNLKVGDKASVDISIGTDVVGSGSVTVVSGSAVATDEKTTTATAEVNASKLKSLFVANADTAAQTAITNGAYGTTAVKTAADTLIATAAAGTATVDTSVGGGAATGATLDPAFAAPTTALTDDTAGEKYVAAKALATMIPTPGAVEVLASDKIGKNAAGDMVYTADGESGLTVTAANNGVSGQISGLTISITDSEGNVKKAANASLDAFSTTIYAKNASDRNELSFQVGAAANQAIAVGLEDMRSEALGLKGSDGTKVSVATQDKANAAVNVFDNAIQKALDQQTTIGSIEARLEYTSQNLTTSSENVQAAESTIRDADMAKEMTNYTKNNVLLQAAQSMLAQANQSSSAVLSLLQ